MKKLTSIFALLLAFVAIASAQYTAVPSSSYPALDAILNAKLAWRVGAGAPSGNCFQGKEVYTDSSTGNFYTCSASNTWTRPIGISGAPSTWPSFATVATSGAYSSLSGIPTTFAPVNPGPSTLGGVRSIDCTGTGHILSISTVGVPQCSADATTGGSMTYPAAGVGNSTGSAWGTSYQVGILANNLVQLTAAAKLPAVDGSLLTNLPSMVYPGAGVPNSTGSAWGTSYAVGTSPGNLVRLDPSTGKLPAVDGSLLTNLPSGGSASGVPYVAGGGTAQAQTATYSPAISSLTDGLFLCWKPAAANTATAPTFAPNGLTAHTIIKVPNGAALVANDLLTTAPACAIYNLASTRWELQNPQTAAAGGSFNVQDASGTPVAGSPASTIKFVGTGVSCIPSVTSGVATVQCDADTGYLPTLTSLQDGSLTCVSASASSTAYTALCGHTLNALVSKQLLPWYADVANTTTGPTLNLDSLGAKPLVKQDGTALAAGDLKATTLYTIWYDGTSFRVVQAGSSAVGTVSSVGFTGGLLSVANATTAPALTVAGTSGGVPYFSSGSTWASSPALTAHGVMLGGGSATAPTSTAAGTAGQVLTSNGSGADPTYQAGAAEVLLASSSPSGTGTVTFSGISGSYEDLTIRIRGRGTNASTFVTVLVQVNGDTGSNYDYEQGGINNSTLSANGFAGMTSVNVGYLPGTTAPGTQGAAAELTLFHYADTTFEKFVTFLGGIKTANTSAGVWAQPGTGWWRSTAAITSITITLSAGNFATGSKVSLYGHL